MPTFKLDGAEIPFEEGDTIIRAAHRQGVEIPHYCWHPGLSVAANCRMCLVEIKSERSMAMPIVEWDEASQSYVPTTKPKLMPACQMPAVEGQEVFAKSDPVKRTQASVQEFLLLNHPVDCPICDQAGECKLQDYYDAHQGTLKRKRSEPVHKVKGERFGEKIVYDGERCVMCTRCIRFCDEVAGDPVLDMRERGNKNEIVLSPGRSLDHDYTLMTEHVCPVGALTSRDFRFKARVWFLKTGASVCAGCATGCNMHVDFDPRTQVVQRLRPQDNSQVNQYWMCDDGMLSYHRFVRERVRHARSGAPESLREHALDEALAIAADALRNVEPGRAAMVLSAQHTSEDNLALVRLANALGIDQLYLGARRGWRGDQILRSADNNPNRTGAQAAAGVELGELEALIERAEEFQVVVALDWTDFGDADELGALSKVPQLVSLSTNESALTRAARLVLPVAAHVEAAGTFVSGKGLTQRFKRVVPPPAGVHPAWQVLTRLAGLLGHDLGFGSIADVRAGLPQAAAAGEVRAP